MGYSVRRRSCCGLGDDVPPIPDVSQLPLITSVASRPAAATLAVTQSLSPLCYSPYADAATRQQCIQMAQSASKAMTAANTAYGTSQSAWDKISAWFNQETFKGVKNAYLVAGGGGLVFLAALAGRKRR
jgi:hypothetical protein